MLSMRKEKTCIKTIQSVHTENSISTLETITKVPLSIVCTYVKTHRPIQMNYCNI